jgi:glycogen(starch) synthase
MRILITTVAFPPSFGGMETAALDLGSGLARRGHEVVVVTTTPSGEPDTYPFRVVRNPDAMTLLRLTAEADVMWQNHVSLRLVWPALLLRKPVIFMHHIWLGTDAVAGTRHGGLKRSVCKLGTNGFVSTALRDAARLDGPIIPNSYNDEVFRFSDDIQPIRDVAFLGRLTRLKGVDLLVDAVAIAAKSGVTITASVIGGGPEEANLKAQAARLGVAEQITFTGPLRGEPFGIVALEAMASGCVPVVANSGALPEVIGPCGEVFKKDDAASLAAVLADLVTHPEKIAGYRDNIQMHLKQYSRPAQMDANEALLAKAVGKH